jgi:DNA-binding winged helix-turn-helix (wHTH) protein
MGMDVRSRKLAVNGVIVDFGSETLCTESGHSIALRPQAFAVLRYLAERAGRLATKDELMHALWSGLVVTDDSLVQCIHEIRRALQDDDRVVLRTAPKRGYRLVLPADIAQHPLSGEFERAAGGIGGTWLGAASDSDDGTSRRTRQGLHRRPAIRQHVFGSRAGVFFRWHHRGRHNRSVAVENDGGRFPQLDFPLQGTARGHPGSRARTRRAIPGGGQRSSAGGARQDHDSVDRRQYRQHVWAER